MKRKAQAVWQGEGLTGQGRLTTGSGALDGQPYSTKMRFEDESGRSGTNPDELIAAALAGCFAMALSFQIGGAGHKPEELAVDAELTMEKEPDGTAWTIKSVHLDLRGKVPGISNEEFQQLAQKAKKGCPVSRVLNAEITLDATLDGA